MCMFGLCSYASWAPFPSTALSNILSAILFIQNLNNICPSLHFEVPGFGGDSGYITGPVLANGCSIGGIAIALAQKLRYNHK